MPTPFKLARITTGAFAAAAIVLMGAAVPAGAGTSSTSSASVQVAAQQFKAQPRDTGPVRPVAPKRMTGKAGAGANSAYGCHDGASQTSYEGPCDNHPEYESTGGCESEATQTSYPGNCRNSSEP
ncbi:MAG: hypothetical protein ACFCUW_02495 [Kiloniellaceae bacterium]